MAAKAETLGRSMRLWSCSFVVLWYASSLCLSFILKTAGFRIKHDERQSHHVIRLSSNRVGGGLGAIVTNTS